MLHFYYLCVLDGESIKKNDMVKRISFSLFLFLSFLCCSYAQEVRDAQHFSSMIGDTLSSSEIDKIISNVSDKVYRKKNGKLYSKKAIYLLTILDKQRGREGTTGSLEAIVEAGSACLTDLKVLGGQINGIEEDTLSPMIPYLSRNELYRMAQAVPIMRGGHMKNQKDFIYDFTRTPFVRRSSKRDPMDNVYPTNFRGSSHSWENMASHIPPHGVGMSTVSTPAHPNIHMSFGVDGKPYIKEFRLPYAASERYDVSGVKVRSVDGQEVYRIDLRSKNPNAAREVVGTVEIDDENRLLRYDGELLGQSLWTMKEGKRNAVRLNCQSHVEYTYRHGFMEVESSRCSVTYDNHEVQILLTNLNETKVKSKKKVKAGNNLIKAIKMAGYDPNLRKEG